MKNTISNLLTTLFALLILTSCNEEQVDTNVYAPNGAVVSTSMEDLNETIANKLKVNTKEIAIESISFLDVAEGFVADVGIYLTATNEITNIFYISPQSENSIIYKDKINISKNTSLRGGNAPFIQGTVATCLCVSGLPSECSVSGRLSGYLGDDIEDHTGIIYIECASLGCGDCEFQILD